jgi:hypothetical protein
MTTIKYDDVIMIATGQRPGAFLSAWAPPRNFF